MQQSRLIPSTSFVASVVCSLFVVTVARAADWRQILGPDRNGISPDEDLAESWPDDGPPVRWSRNIGSGNAGVAVAKKTGVLFHRLGDQEVVEAFDVVTGDARWKQSYPTSFVPQVGEDDGPLCVPAIQAGKVFTFGAQGVLSCWEQTTGKPVWQLKTHDEFAALAGYFGAGSSPLVWEDRVIVNVGGHKANAGVVAFAVNDGRTLWQVTDERASYAAPVAATIDGKATVICITRMKCFGLDPADGSVLFELPFGRSGPTVNAAVPILIDEKLFLTASYGIGAVLARLSTDDATELWRRPEVLASQYTTPIMYKGDLYGIDGRDDGPPADLKCLDPLTGETHWTERRFGYATLIGAGDKLLIAKTDGELVLAHADPKAYRPISRHRLTTQAVRALPALSAGRLFLRDSETLFCVEVGQVN